MQIEFLGSGGAISTPRPGCECPVCTQARARGVPYSRSGPSLFVHGPDVLIDTPEEIKQQINRSRIRRINACFYSHWHPDHVMGRRVWEELNQDWRNWPPRNACTDIYFPQQVGQDFRRRLGSWEHFTFMERQGVVRLVELADGEHVQIGETRIEPFRLAQAYVYAFLFETNQQRVLIAPDELFGWMPPEQLRGVDLAVLPMGIAELDPFTGERRIPRDHPVLTFEATFDQTLRMVEALGARRVILTHIEESDGLGYDDLLRLQQRLQVQGYPIEFAYDTMLVGMA